MKRDYVDARVRKYLTFVTIFEYITISHGRAIVNVRTTFDQSFRHITESNEANFTDV